MESMQLKKGDIVELEITDLAFGGAGVGKLKTADGGDLAIFIERVVPGDRVSARITKSKKNFAEARLEKILTPSAARITPRCKHFGVCGGCTFQFLSYEDQLKWKEKIVKDAIERIGGFRDLPINPIWPSPNEWFYRNKMEFTFLGDEKIILGLHARGRFDEIFDLEECYLESEFAVAVIQWTKQWANRNSNEGLLKNLVIREARSTGELMVNLVTSGEPFGAREKFAEEITAQFPRITSLYHTTVNIKKGMRTRIEETLLAGKPNLTEIMRVGQLSLIFDIAPQAFFQTNTTAAEGLIQILLALGKPHPDETVLDLYCGTGIMGMFFAKLAKKVYGVELNASAIENARKNASKNGLNNIEFICGDAAESVKTIDEKPDIIIVDPPRAGLMPKTVEELLRIAPQKILYVSCNPTTLARDLKILCKGYPIDKKGNSPATNYLLKKIQPLDMFPQTYHVECVCRLDRLP